MNRNTLRRLNAILVTAAVWTAGMFLGGTAQADPTVEDIAPPLPVVVATPSGFQPKFPWPYDKTQGSVTPADINAEREMCQWFNAQYDTLMTQIDNFSTELARRNGDYNYGATSAIADSLTQNISQAVDFLTPRAQALTISTDHMGDLYFPLFQGESFYRIWEQLSNVRDGIRGRQPAWFYGPSYQVASRWGSKIKHSAICRQ